MPTRLAEKFLIPLFTRKCEQAGPEEQAYQLDARYTRDPKDVFSVGDEVRDWLRAGRFS